MNIVRLTEREIAKVLEGGGFSGPTTRVLFSVEEDDKGGFIRNGALRASAVAEKFEIEHIHVFRVEHNGNHEQDVHYTIADRYNFRPAVVLVDDAGNDLGPDALQAVAAQHATLVYYAAMYAPIDESYVVPQFGKNEARTF